MILWRQSNVGQFCFDFWNKIVAQVMIQTHLCFIRAILKVENSKGAFSHLQMDFLCFVSKKICRRKVQKQVGTRDISSAKWNYHQHETRITLISRFGPSAFEYKFKFYFRKPIIPGWPNKIRFFLTKMCQKTSPGSHWVSVRGGWKKVSDYRHPPMTDFNSQL